MRFGICHLGVVPVRRDPADFHEQINQILFGERFEILETNEKWVLLQTAHDGYQGWIDRKQFVPISKDEYEDYGQILGAIRNPFAQITTSLGISSYIPMGSLIPIMRQQPFRLGSDAYYIKEGILENLVFNPEILWECIQAYLNSPYQWGGRTPMGIDCSGFTQVIFRLMGVALPRDASQQVVMGNSLSFLEEVRLGDLAFFGSEEGKITHVGILLDTHRIVHASGKVRIDWVDHMGIFNRELGTYTHQLRTIRRVTD